MTTRFDDDSYNRHFDKNYVTPTRDYYPKEEEDKKEKYIPSPKDVEDIALVDDEISLMENLAVEIHEMWAKERIKQGWVYGHKRDDKYKQHPCLIPYNELPEEEKVIDISVAKHLLKTIKCLGYEINKRRNNNDKTTRI